MALRIRLQSFAPLPSFRVWFLVPQNVVDVQTLKLVISAQLPALKGSDIQPEQLVLEMDGFELLDECSICLIRDGDIIVISAKELAAVDKLKSNANVEMAPSALKRMLSKGSLRRSSSSSSDSSTSDSSTSDPSASDSSALSSPSDSDSDDSKPIPCPKALFPPSKQKPQSKGISPVVSSHAASRIGTSGIQQPVVPPGLGKPSTHSRNKRRKLKRKYAGAQSSFQNENLTLPTGVNGGEMTSIGSEGVLSSAMRSSDQPASGSITPHSNIRLDNNDNGSMEAMEGTPPQKLDSTLSSVPTISECATAFIPPSERGDLPKNIFVTSVEINWRINQWRTNRQDHNMAEPWVPLDDTHAMQLSDPGLQQTLNWAAIETGWGKYKTLDASMQLLPNTIVAWKAFGLDPVTLTPQASMVHLGKVVSVDIGNVVVQPLTRPNIERATFGRTSVGEDQEALEQISYSHEEVWSNEWKFICHNTEVEI